MRRIHIEAHAKVNLGLSVTGARPDGYHDIETLFQTISLSDTVFLEASKAGIGLSCEGIQVPGGPSNLAWQAATLLTRELAAPAMSITLFKRIPVGAGLGGGSADAAAVLMGGRALFDLEASDTKLMSLALEIGSDVPFLLRGGTARGVGRGEILEPVAPLSGFCLLLVTPAFKVRAEDAYARVRIGLTRDASYTKLNSSAIREGELGSLVTAFRNDLEPGVVACYPEVGAVKQALLDAGVQAAVMSGSGPTVIGLVRSSEEATSLLPRLGGHGWQIHIVEPIDSGCRVEGA
jgi:4-diphosphocytidyl-2-C-methyl-D-erythritol kinase